MRYNQNFSYMNHSAPVLPAVGLLQFSTWSGFSFYFSSRIHVWFLWSAFGCTGDRWAEYLRSYSVSLRCVCMCRCWSLKVFVSCRRNLAWTSFAQSAPISRWALCQTPCCWARCSPIRVSPAWCHATFTIISRALGDLCVENCEEIFSNLRWQVVRGCQYYDSYSCNVSSKVNGHMELRRYPRIIVINTFNSLWFPVAHHIPERDGSPRTWRFFWAAQSRDLYLIFELLRPYLCHVWLLYHMRQEWALNEVNNASG